MQTGMKKRVGFLHYGRPAQGYAYDIALNKMQLQRFVRDKVFGRNKCDTRQPVVERKRHELKAQERTVMVPAFDHQAVVVHMVHGIFVMGEKMHEFLGRGAKQQYDSQPQRGDDMCNSFSQVIFAFPDSKITIPGEKNIPQSKV